MACRTGCPTQDHASWGECARAASLRIAYCGIGGVSATDQRKWDSELASYRAARDQGIQPRTTKKADVQAAVKVSDMTGTAFQAV